MSLDDLRDRSESLAVRIAAVRSAAELIDMDDEMANALGTIVRDRTEPEELRAEAAIALGPVLEECDIDGFDDDGICEPPISEEAFHAIQAALRQTHDDAGDAKLVRRRALEATVRATADWTADAIRAAYAGGDPEWKLTAVFAMQYVPGFDAQILASLEDPDARIRAHAVDAAGAHEIAAAWPHVQRLLVPPANDRDLLLSAIEAAPLVAPPGEADSILAELSESDDEDIAAAAEDAMTFLDDDL